MTSVPLVAGMAGTAETAWAAESSRQTASTTKLWRLQLPSLKFWSPNSGVFDLDQTRKLNFKINWNQKKSLNQSLPRLYLIAMSKHNGNFMLLVARPLQELVAGTAGTAESCGHRTGTKSKKLLQQHQTKQCLQKTTLISTSLAASGTSANSVRSCNHTGHQLRPAKSANVFDVFKFKLNPLNWSGLIGALRME